MGAPLEYWFYHLQQSSLEAVLPDILDKTRAKGWRCLLKIGASHGDAAAQMRQLDTYLWTYKQSAFLPHGCDDEPLADAQPILLSYNCEDCDNFDVVILVKGAELAQLAHVQRCITILDGHNEADKAVSRKRWKQAKEDGLPTAYWQQNDHGRWVQPKL